MGKTQGEERQETKKLIKKSPSQRLTKENTRSQIMVAQLHTVHQNDIKYRPKSDDMRPKNNTTKTH